MVTNMLSKSTVNSVTLIVLYAYQHAALSPTHSPRHAPAATTRTLRQFQMLSPGLARPFDRPMLCISVYYMLCYAFTPPWIWPPLAPLHQGPLIILYQSIHPAPALPPSPSPPPPASVPRCFSACTLSHAATSASNSSFVMPTFSRNAAGVNNAMVEAANRPAWPCLCSSATAVRVCRRDCK